MRPSTTFNDPGYCIEYGKRVSNYDTDSPFGTVSFHQALQYSINSVFCEVGKQLGAREILEFGRRFGMYPSPGLELPGGEQRPSGLYEKGRLFFPKQDFDADPGRLAFGQERLGITPLQMAMIASAIANGGVLMQPYLVELVRAPGGKVVLRHEPKEVGTVMKPTTAQRADRDDGRRRLGRNGDGRPDLRGRGGREDRHRRDRRRGPQHDVVRRVRPREGAQIAVAVALENQSRHRRLDGCPDRARDPDNRSEPRRALPNL